MIPSLALMLAGVSLYCCRAVAWTARSRGTRLVRCFQSSSVRQRFVGNSRIASSTVHYARRFDRESFFSTNDLGPEERSIPPTLDSQHEDEGFGAYDYEMDDYDLHHFMQQEQLASGVLPEASSTATTEDESPEKISSDSEPIGFEESTSQPTDFPVSTEELDKPVAPFVFESIETSPDTETQVETEKPVADFNKFLARASSGNGITTDLDILEEQLHELVDSIYQQNNGREFNVNSPRQVSEVLYGTPGESTKKDILEGMAGAGNRMADLILQYRSLKQQMKRLSRKQESIEKGTRVRSASTVRRVSSSIESSDPLILVDASAFIFRAYFSMPPIHRSDGMPTGAVLGFCNMLNRLVLNRMVNGEKPRVVLVFDAKGKNFRHDLYSAYKANRPEAPMDLIPQFDLVRYAAIAYGIPQIEAPNYEADDVIATLSRMAQEEGIDANILSGDKDLMQLVSAEGVEPVVHMVDPMKMERITVKEVLEKWGVGPEKLGDVLALAGDSVDNIRGVPGIGPKTAALLIQEFGSLDQLLENVDKIKQQGRRTALEANMDQAKLSRALVELNQHVPLESMTFPEGIDQVRDLHIQAMDGERLLEFYNEMGFRDLHRRVQSRLDGIKRKRTRSRYRKPKTDIPNPQEFKDVPF